MLYPPFSREKIEFLSRESKKLKIARIAGYCAKGTECSDHSLKNTKTFFRIDVVFLHVVRKKLNAKIELGHN